MEDENHVVRRMLVVLLVGYIRVVVHEHSRLSGGVFLFLGSMSNISTQTMTTFFKLSGVDYLCCPL